MLALRGFEAHLAPKRGLHSGASAGVARSRPVPGIGAAATPPRFEREPGATHHWLEAVASCHALFLLLCLLHRGKLCLLLIRAPFAFVHPARYGLYLVSRGWA